MLVPTIYTDGCTLHRSNIVIENPVEEQVWVENSAINVGFFHCHVWYGMDIYILYYISVYTYICTYILFKWSKLIPNDPRILAVLATLGTLQVFLSFLELSHEVADHLQMLSSQIMEYLISEGAPNGRWRPIYRLMWVLAKRCQKYSKVIKPAARSLQKLVLFKSSAILVLSYVHICSPFNHLFLHIPSRPHPWSPTPLPFLSTPHHAAAASVAVPPRGFSASPTPGDAGVRVGNGSQTIPKEHIATQKKKWKKVM